MPDYRTGDGEGAAVLFVTLKIPAFDWFKQSLMTAILTMCYDNSWEQVGTATAAFALDKSNEMRDSISFSQENPLPVYKPPVGSINLFVDDNVPSGWLACHGQSVLRSTYAELFSIIGTRFGNVDGTHFNIPDLRQRFLVGSSHLVAGYEIADTGGEASVTLDVTQIPAHTHNVGRGNPSGSNLSFTAASVQNFISNQVTSSTGGGGSHENRPPYIALETMIYTGVS